MRAVALVGLSLVLGCSPDKRDQPTALPPSTAITPIADAQALADAPPRVEPGHVRLPRSPDGPPHRTSRPLGKPELARLAAIEHPDFEREDRGTTDRSAEVRHTTSTRPTLGVTIKIEPCGHPVARTRARRSAAAPPRPGPHDCPAMELGAWQAHADQLKHALPADLLARPDTRFELGTRDVSGVACVYTYQLGASFGNDDKGQPTGNYTDAYILYYNDGVNQIRVNAAYLDDAVGGVEHLLAVAPPEDLEKLAVAFLGFYLHEWK